MASDAGIALLVSLQIDGLEAGAQSIPVEIGSSDALVRLNRPIQHLTHYTLR